MTVVCLRGVGRAAERAAERLPAAWLFDLNAAPQNVCVASLPPSIPIAPALPPLPTWCWFVGVHDAALRRVVAVRAEAERRVVLEAWSCRRRGPS